MKTTAWFPLLLAAGLTAGCYVERPHHYYRQEEVVVPRPNETVVETDVNYGPPPPVRVEVRPVNPYYGAVWVPGHWHREHYRRAWVWIPGHWQ